MSTDFPSHVAATQALKSSFYLQISTGPDTRSDSRTTWTKVPGTISPSRSSYRDNGRTLVITSTIVSDTGTYRYCAN